MIKFIKNKDHYKEVIERISTAKKFVWIGTSDIKDVHIKSFNGVESFLASLNRLAQKKVEIRLLYAKSPGQNFSISKSKYPLLKKAIEEQLCVRVHFKIVIIDGAFAYVGSANLTGAGLGMKSDNNRNFETGIITTDDNLVNSAMEEFDSVWMGSYCKQCGRKSYCPKPII